MLQISGLKDELSETLREIKVEWKIANFFMLSQETGVFYQSSFFSFAESHWSLEIFPGGDNIQDDTGWISVYIRGHDLDTPKSIIYSLGIKKVGELNEFLIKDKTHTFDQICSGDGQKKFYSRSELLKKKAELLPSDDLTITCIFTDNTVKRMEVLSRPVKLTELEKLSTDFRNLLSCKRSCDATVKVKDKEFQVHKSILIARSAVFESMFEHDMSEKESGIVSITDCDPDSFGEFLHYLYTGKTENITTRSALNLYCTSDKYDVKELKSFCVRYMMYNLTIENVIDVASLAEEYEESRLLSAVQVFFNSNVSRILSTVKWEELMQEDHRLANKLLKEMAAKIKLQA